MTTPYIDPNRELRLAETEPRVLVFYNKPQEFLPQLAVRFPTARFFSCTSYQELSVQIDEVRPHIVLAAKFEPKPFPRQTILDCPTLHWLSVAFAGVDHVVPWNDSRIVVTNASGVAAEEMAQYVVAAIFGLHQRFPYFARQQFERCWDYQLIRSARGATVGLVGLGHTGEAIARLCRAVGLKVVAYRSSPQPSELVDRVYAGTELQAMLATVDVTVVCAALTTQTRDLMDKKAFAAIKPGGYFINVARGGIVDENALLEALHSGQLGGAMIDVTQTEPLPASSELWGAPNLLITPHTSSEYEGWVARAAGMFADNLERWLAGTPLVNSVYSDRGY